MAKPLVLVIEDDAAIRGGLVDALEFEGYSARGSAGGDEATELASYLACDLVLLDLVLPGADGLEILAKVRQVRPTLPVIVLTALGAERDRVRGLKLGADDYVVKPFGIRELLARVEAVLRRSPARPSNIERISLRGGGEVDLARLEARFANGRRLEISEREAELLRYLACHAGRAISREEILSHVWRINPEGLTTRTIDMHVARLREKLEDNPADPQVILTVRGKGYMLRAPELSPRPEL